MAGWMKSTRGFDVFSRKNRTEASFVVLFLFAAQKEEIT